MPMLRTRRSSLRTVAPCGLVTRTGQRDCAPPDSAPGGTTQCRRASGHRERRRHADHLVQRAGDDDGGAVVHGGLPPHSTVATTDTIACGRKVLFPGRLCSAPLEPYAGVTPQP